MVSFDPDLIPDVDTYEVIDWETRYDQALEALDAMQKSRDYYARRTTAAEASETRLTEGILALRNEWAGALNMEEIFKHHAAERLDDILEGTSQ